MVSIEWPIVIVQLITFILGMILVWNTMIKALRDTLKSREAFIGTTLDKIEKDKKEIEDIKADYEKKAHEMQAQSAAASIRPSNAASVCCPSALTEINTQP